MSSRSLKGSSAAAWAKAGSMVPALAFAVVTAACGGGNQQTPASGGSAAPAAAPAAAVDPATAATITGTVKLEGTAPKPDPIKMNADPVCAREGKGQTTEFIVAGGGGELQNAFVYVKDGLGGRTFQAPSEAVVLDQKGCHYRPHVFGVMVGQPLQIVNSDPTLHNVHAIPKSNQEFNTGQPIQGMKFDHTFTAKEVMVPFKCDVHGWMNAYAGVLDHPFFATTDASGKFELKGLPPGDYTIEVWHEKLGAQEQKITVGAKESKEANFSYKATS
jgi:plastocyanin